MCRVCETHSSGFHRPKLRHSTASLSDLTRLLPVLPGPRFLCLLTLYHFRTTGDFIYSNFLADLAAIADSGVRVALYYGDADYICSTYPCHTLQDIWPRLTFLTDWFGGEAVSLALNYTHAAEFAAAGYAPLVYGGVEYGEVRECTFCRIVSL